VDLHFIFPEAGTEIRLIPTAISWYSATLSWSPSNDSQSYEIVCHPVGHTGYSRSAVLTGDRENYTWKVSSCNDGSGDYPMG